MNLRALKPIAVVLALVCGAGPPPALAAGDADSLKAEIDGFIHQMLSTGRGLLDWDGADGFDVKDEGDGAVAVITNGRILVRKAADPKTRLATVTLDRLEIHRHPAAQGGELVEYDIALPARWDVVVAGGGEAVLSLDQGKLTAVLEGEKQHQRRLSLAVAGGHLDVEGSASKASFGPISANWKLAANGDGGWTSPADFALKGIDVDVAEAPLAVSIDHIAYAGDASGPSVAALDALHDQAGETRADIEHDPNRAAAQSLNLIAKALAVFSGSQGEATIEGVTAKRPDGETLLTLKKATLSGALSGLSGGDTATIHVAVGHDDLTIAPSLLPAPQVPRHVKLEFGVENIADSVLRQIAEAAAKLPPDASDSDRQQATAQMIAAALTLQPVFRVYDAVVDFKDVGIEASAEVKRAPPAPIGFAAVAEIKVRNFDGLSDIVTAPALKAKLPLLEFLGEPDTGSDGTAILKYRLAQRLGQPLTVNGNNLGAWSAGAPAKNGPAPEQPRILRLAEPPLTGDDVRAVQQALGTSRIKPLAQGVYDTATALAVMRFQKERGMNVDGVVDPPTRDKLGLAPAAPRALKSSPDPKN